jgi:hypothetical protein
MQEVQVVGRPQRVPEQEVRAGWTPPREQEREQGQGQGQARLQAQAQAQVG